MIGGGTLYVVHGKGIWRLSLIVKILERTEFAEILTHTYIPAEGDGSGPCNSWLRDRRHACTARDYIGSPYHFLISTDQVKFSPFNR
jgi:hypothetical protein